MPKNKFLIAPINSGLQTNVTPFLIPDDAFSIMNNMQIYESRIVKRFGSRFTGGSTATQLNSRLRHFLTDYPVLGVGGTVFTVADQVGYMFSIESTTPGLTYYFHVFNTTPGFQSMRSNCPVGTFVFNAASGDYFFSNLPADAIGQPIYFYPGIPVMGFGTYENIFGGTPNYVSFDTRYSYRWDPVTATWNQFGLDDGVNPTSRWSGNNTNFFSSISYRALSSNQNLLFVTNNNEFEDMRYYNETDNKWYYFKPIWSAVPIDNYIKTAKIVKYFKDRIIYFNIAVRDPVAAQTIRVTNLVMWSAPNANPLDLDAFREGMGGGSLIGPVNQEIIAVDIFKDHLLVFFSDSIWELAYTFNDYGPFIWKLINDNRGASGINSLIDLDEAILSLDNRGIIGCNGSAVQEIDQKIPEEIFYTKDTLSLTSSIYKINGIRDYKNKICYWTYPRSDSTSDYPYTDRILSFNYETGSWSFIDDSITCFSTFLEGQSASEHERYERIIAGNQQGFIFVTDLGIYRNSPALNVTGLTVAAGSPNVMTVTCYEHNLKANDYFMIENLLSSPSGTITDLNNRIFKVVGVTDKNIFTFNGDTGEDYTTGLYVGGATIARVTPPEIKTKEYGFYMNKGLFTYVSKTDFMVSKTTSGEFTVDTYVSTASNSLLADGSSTGTLVGTNIVTTKPITTFNDLENNQTRFWHPIYLQASGEVVQLKVYFTDATKRNDSQIRNPLITHSELTIHAMLFETEPSNQIL